MARWSGRQAGWEIGHRLREAEWADSKPECCPRSRRWAYRVSSKVTEWDREPATTGVFRRSPQSLPDWLQQARIPARRLGPRRMPRQSEKSVFPTGGLAGESFGGSLAYICRLTQVRVRGSLPALIPKMPPWLKSYSQTLPLPTRRNQMVTSASSPPRLLMSRDTPRIPRISPWSERTGDLMVSSKQGPPSGCSTVSR